MLKNKKAIYILIPLNFLIWGFFIYRFYAAYTDSDVSMPIAKIESVKLENLKDSLTYNLSLDYKDPFLKEGERAYKQSNSGNGISESTPKRQVISVKAPTVPPKQLPEVKYLGLIKNNTSGLTTALVSVNGQSRLIKQNESIDGIVFKSFSRDSLTAKWGKERIVVRK